MRAGAAGQAWMKEKASRLKGCFVFLYQSNGFFLYFWFASAALFYLARMDECEDDIYITAAVSAAVNEWHRMGKLEPLTTTTLVLGSTRYMKVTASLHHGQKELLTPACMSITAMFKLWSIAVCLWGDDMCVCVTVRAGQGFRAPTCVQCRQGSEE